MSATIAVLGFAGIGVQELLLIFLIVLLVFGAAKIPEIARSLGRAIREFKKGAKDEPEESSPKTPTSSKNSPDKP